MQLEQFKGHLLLYGSNLSDWPQELKCQAITLIDAEPMCKHLLDDEKAFERLIQRDLISPSKRFVENILRQATVTSHEILPVPRTSFFQHIMRLTPFSQPAYVFASITILGFVGGMFMQSDSPAVSELGNFFYDAWSIL